MGTSESITMASIGQEGLWSIELFDNPGPAFNTLFSTCIIGKYSEISFFNFFQNFINRHKICKANFKQINGRLHLVENSNSSLFFNSEDVSRFSNNKEALLAYATSLSKQLFDLENGPLFKVHFLKVSKNRVILLLCIHHTISDGFSYQILINELHNWVDQYSKNNNIDLIKLDKDYSEFSQWQQNLIFSEEGNKQKQYWEKRLSGNLPNLFKFNNIKESKETKYNGNIFQFSINDNQTKRIKEYTKNRQISLFSFFMSIYQIVLFKYFGENDIVIGHPSSGRLRTTFGRKRADFSDNFGYFVNPLLFKNRLEDSKSLNTFFNETNNLIKEDSKHQDYPFPKLFNTLKLHQKDFEIPQVLINFQKKRNDKRDLSAYKFYLDTYDELISGNLRFEPFYIPQQLGSSDLEWEIMESNSKIYCNLKYRYRRFNTDSIKLLSNHISSTIDNIINNSYSHISDIEILSTSEKNQILKNFNKSIDISQKNKFLHSAFKKVLLHNKYKPAIILNNHKITYNDLDQKSNFLAQDLHKNGINNNDTIALMFEKSPEYIITIIASIKLGVTFVPIDPELPLSRIKMMIEDSNSKMIVSNTEQNFSFTKISNYLVSLNQLQNLDNFKNNFKSQDRNKSAYIIFTSGSTGKPKGVINTHSGLLNMITSVSKYMNIYNNENILQFASFSFDASIFEIFLALLTGSSLTLFPKSLSNNLELFKELIEKHGITTAVLPPTFLQRLNKFRFKNLKNLITAGESPILSDVKFYSKFLNYFNAYGPTETSVCASIYKIENDTFKNAIIPIGKPINNINIKILNKYNKLSPIGIEGEICISGVGVALGYVNRQELTDEKFVKDPFLPDSRMYKTGDIGKWDSKGNIIFLGRKDNQVKISGYRIELGEIESVLFTINEIKDCCIITEKIENDVSLLAFIKTSKNIEKITIKKTLSKSLPFYMIPSEIIFVDEFPLTNSGKKDTKYLLKIYQKEQIIPKDNTQKKEIINSIRKIWAEILLNKKSTDDSNFFDMGGNSLQVAELKNRIKKLTGADLEVTDLFKHTTISSQAQLIHEMTVNVISTESSGVENHKSEKQVSKDIAVIGMAGRFPEAENVTELWENLIKGKESISTFTEEELLKSGIPKNILSKKDYIKSKGVISDADMFDADFFGYSPREAELIDPQQRIFLECSYMALQDAGYTPTKYKGKIGLFASSSHNSYLTNNILPNHDIYGKDYYSILTGNEKDFIATRVAYKLNLKGPAQTIQTACSSSLVGIHYACESIINGSSDIAMAGGVSITLPLKSGYSYTPDGIGSPDGHCRPFDSSSEGTVPGNGVAVVVLKSLEEAQNDGDHIYAIIKGSAINNDGSDKIGFTAPSITGQEEVVKNALYKANVKPKMISHIETHGTGTKLGDPIEIKALSNVFGLNNDHQCSLGSIKANIGHLDSAAGVTGFIKAVLTLYHQQVPPNINFAKPNPEINFKDTPFFVNKNIINWQDENVPKYAGISSLGLGGTNAHIILKSPPKNNFTKNKPLVKNTFTKKRYWLDPKINSQNSTYKRQSNPTDWLYAPIWKPTVVSNKNHFTELKSISRTWLIFKDENHLSEQISELLKNSTNRVITVSFRRSYSESEWHYSIDPNKKEDYDKLFISLKYKEILPDHIIHLPLFTKDRHKSLNANNLKPISYLGFFSLLFTTKSLQHINHKKCKITIVSDHVFSVNGEDWINPLKSTVIGPINVIPQEHPGITCQHIDISLDSKAGNINQISEYLINDLLNYKKETTIAYRNHRRWIKSYEKLNVEAGEINLKEGKVYFITGGLGGIGLKTALFIAELHKVTLILSGKNVLPPEERWDHILEKYKDNSDPLLKKIRKIKEIRALGSKVITLCTDIQNRQELSKSLEHIEKYHGKIDGVIHAAGTGGNQLISTKTIENVESVFDPKIKGTLYLQSYFSHHKLDFFILFSSLSSISGGIEQVAYSSANAFLDAVAAHNFTDRHLQTLAINWPGWKDTGMTLKMRNYNQLKHLQDTHQANTISSEEGINTLKLCLSLGPVYRLIVSPHNFNEWRNSINSDLEKEVQDLKSSVNHNRPNLTTNLQLPQSREEQEMTRIWENILHISPIGTTDNFFDLGGHSLLGLELLAQIAEVKKCSLQLNDLYENPTISSISELIYQKEMLSPFAEFKMKRSKNTKTNLIIQLKKGSTKNSIYLFQPAGVNVFFYQQLASTISDELNVFGVRLTDLEEGHNIDKTIEEIAQRCLEQILNHTSEGKINLAGSSFGGVVAYEVAQQLKNRNIDIGILSMFDSPGPNHLPIEPKDDAEILHRIFSQWIPISLSTLKHEKIFDKQCRYIMSMIEHNSETSLIISPDQIELLLSISKNSIIALSAYSPIEYNGSILFIKPLDFHPNYDKYPERAWRKYVKGDFIIKNVPGDHLTMNVQPNVHNIGKILSQELL